MGLFVINGFHSIYHDFLCGCDLRSFFVDFHATRASFVIFAHPDGRNVVRKEN